MIQSHWRSIWSGLLVSGITLYAARGASQTPDRVCDPNDPKSCVQALTEGQAAPFPGMLLTYRRAAKLGVMAEGCQDRIDLAIQREQEIAQIKYQGIQQLRENDKQMGQMQVDLLNKRLAEQAEILPPRWYERPAFVVVVSSLTTVAVLALGVKTVQVLK